MRFCCPVILLHVVCCVFHKCYASSSFSIPWIHWHLTSHSFLTEKRRVACIRSQVPSKISPLMALTLCLYLQLATDLTIPIFLLPTLTGFPSPQENNNSDADTQHEWVKLVSSCLVVWWEKKSFRGLFYFGFWTISLNVTFSSFVPRLMFARLVTNLPVKLIAFPVLYFFFSYFSMEFKFMQMVVWLYCNVVVVVS